MHHIQILDKNYATNKLNSAWKKKDWENQKIAKNKN